MSSAKTFQCKLVLLGDSAVGKSSLVLRFVKKQFFDYQESTIGAAYLTQTVSLDDGDAVRFEIWDTAGQERYNSLAPMYYRGAASAVVVYDITNAYSFERAKSWVNELQAHDQGMKRIVIALAGNKLDMEEQRQVPTSAAKLFAEENGLIFFETSAKANINVTETFYRIAHQLPRSTKPTGHTGVKIGDTNEEKGKCC